MVVISLRTGFGAISFWMFVMLRILGASNKQVKYTGSELKSSGELGDRAIYGLKY